MSEAHLGYIYSETRGRKEFSCAKLLKRITEPRNMSYFKGSLHHLFACLKACMEGMDGR